MSREGDILAAIDDTDGFTFQKLARRLLQRELYPELNPLPEQNDLGQDARTEELPVLDLPGIERPSERITFAISKTTTKSKVTEDCDSCRDNGLDVDKFIFVTSGEVSNKLRQKWRDDIETEYEWYLTVYDRTWFADIGTKPEHEKLVDELLNVPPLNGDYHDEILQAFERVTDGTLSPEESHLPSVDLHIDLPETSEILGSLSKGEDVVVTGDAGRGKTGVLNTVVHRWDATPILFMDARAFSEVSNDTEFRQEFDLNGPVDQAVKRLDMHSGCLLGVDQLDNIGGTPASQQFVELLEKATELENISTLVGCRRWDLDNRSVYEPLRDDESFTRVELAALTESTVNEALQQLGITDTSDELVQLSRNLLNLSILSDLSVQPGSGSVNFAQIKSQVELWDHYQQSLVERETEGGQWDAESGHEVRTRAVELAEDGLVKASSTVPASPHVNRADSRLISRSVLQHERGERYRFRHEELQDYFYAWNAVNREEWTSPRPVLKEIDEHVATGIFRWMLQLLHVQDDSLALEFLDDALAPDGLNYYAASTVVKEITEWDPMAESGDFLAVIVDRITRRTELQKHFYNNLTESAWAAVLYHQGRFGDPPATLVSYLERVSSEVPGIVTDVIETTETESQVIKAWLVQITESLPSDVARPTLDVFQDWLRESPNGPYSSHYADLIEPLLENGEQEYALKLLDTLLEPQAPNPQIHEYDSPTGEVRQLTMDREATAQASIYTIESTIEDVFEHVTGEDEEQALEILAENLRTAIELEVEDQDRDPEKIRWPVAIDHEELTNQHLKEVLLSKLRVQLEDWISENPQGDVQRQWVTDLLEDEFVFFYRLGLHLLGTAADDYPDLVLEELLDETNYDAYPIKTEFFLLLEAGYPYLSERGQQEVLQIIESGRGLDDDRFYGVAEVRQEDFPGYSVNEIVEVMLDQWKLQRFWMIRNHLPDSYSKEMEKLIEQHGEPDHPESDISRRWGQVTTKGPMDFEELRDLSPAELIELCVSWDPEDAEDSADFYTEISARGLAKDLKRIVSESPEEFVPHLSILQDADAVYISHTLSALEDAIEKDRYFDWPHVLELCEKGSTRLDEEKGTVARMDACRLLRTGLADESSRLVPDHSCQVRDILVTFTDDPNPELPADSDRDYLAHDDPILDALNTVRPIAVSALITYALVKAKEEEFEGFQEEGSSGLGDEVKTVLVQRLDDQSTAVHLVFGQHLGNLRWLDSAWVTGNLDDIFPRQPESESRARFIAAWTAYIGQNQWYKEGYSSLKPHYEYAIDLLSDEEWSADNTLGKRFVGHVLCSHLHTDEELGDDDSLLTAFYTNVVPDLASTAAWQLWRWGNNNSEFRDRWNSVRQIWEWRMDMVDAEYETFSDEFQWFTEWLDLIGDETDPGEIQELMHATIPYVVEQRRSWETIEQYLSNHVEEHPLAAVEVYEQLINQHDIPSYKEFDETVWNLLETALQAGGEPKKVARRITEEIAIHDSDYLELLDEYRMD